MATRILIVAQGSTATDAEAVRLLARQTTLAAQEIPLEALPAMERASSESEAVIGIASSDLVGTISFLGQLREKACDRALLAVLPAHAGAGLLEAAVGLVDDFALWPVRPGELDQRIRRLFARKGPGLGRVSERLTDEFALGQMVGQHPAFRRVLVKMPIVAKIGEPVLITGETGTGKELSARAVHHLSRRRDYPFIAVDCGALPEHLVENELFGHARGAFTDAHRDQKGLIAMAEKGTLFLDEIDALPLSTQAKLLRFLQERTYKPLGSERVLHADLNLLAASNRDLETLVARQQFRADLYYRLNVFRLSLPALRERHSDIPLLARHFVDVLVARGELGPKSLSPGALLKLETYVWPGNVRELFNVIQQAVAYSSAAQIDAEELVLPGQAEKSENNVSGLRQGRANAVESFERSFIQDLLQKHAGNVTRAALEARKDRRSFGRLMKKYSIERRPA